MQVLTNASCPCPALLVVTCGGRETCSCSCRACRGAPYKQCSTQVDGGLRLWTVISTAGRHLLQGQLTLRTRRAEDVS